MAYTASRAGPSTSGPSDASRTLTVHDSQPREGDGADDAADDPDFIGTLRLRGARGGPRVAWAEEVIDNEGMGKKKSKICCIYHKPRAFDESSSEDDSDSDSDGGAKPAGYRKRRGRHHHHDHPHENGHDHHADGGAPGGGATLDGAGGGSVAVLEPEPEPNAYERGGKGKKKADM